MEDRPSGLGDHCRYHARSYAISAPNFDTNIDDHYRAFSALASVVPISCGIGLGNISVDRNGDILPVPQTDRCVFLAASYFEHLLVVLAYDGAVGAICEPRYFNIGCVFISNRHLYLRIQSNP